MPALTTYTTYDEVRAVLGVSTDELEDDTLALGVYSSALTAELEDINLNLPTQFNTVAAVAVETRSESEQRFYDGVQLFATYAVAKQCCSSLPMFGPKDITDGKAAISRFADSPYKQTIEEVKRQYERHRTRVEQLYAALLVTTVTAVPRVFMSTAGLPVDPVTGS